MRPSTRLSSITVALCSLSFACLAACASAPGAQAGYDEDGGTTADKGDDHPADAGHAKRDAATYPTCLPGEPGCPGGPASPTELPDAGADSGRVVAAGDAGPAQPGTDPKACNLVNDCMGAANAGEIAGDTGSESITLQGSESKWFTFRVREDSSFGGSTSFTASLISPPGANYDLHVFMDTQADVIECSKEAAASSLPAGTTDKVNMTWGWAFYNDSRTVRIQVRHVGGTCTSAQWTLFIEGNRQ